MDKFQDGFFAFRDSTKPLVVTGASRNEPVYISVVGEKILIAPIKAGSRLKFFENSDEGVVFSVVPEGQDATPELSETRLADEAVI